MSASQSAARETCASFHLDLSPGRVCLGFLTSTVSCLLCGMLNVVELEKSDLAQEIPRSSLKLGSRNLDEVQYMLLYL